MAANGLATVLYRFDLKQTGDATYRGRCPCCGGKSQKLSVRVLDDRILMRCFGGCEVLDVLGAVGLQVSDLFADKPGEHSYPPSRSSMPAREALALIDHEVMVALLIINDVREVRTFDDSQLERLALASERISDARNGSCPARVRKEAVGA